MNQELKDKVYFTCQEILSEKLEDIQFQMNELIDGAQNDSKSTAGDKHETGRAMMQQEQEQLGKILHQLEMRKSYLDRLDHTHTSPSIAEGSLVQTHANLFYIAVPLGKIEIGFQEVFVISSDSPLGKQLKGKIRGEKVVMNGLIHEIISFL